MYLYQSQLISIKNKVSETLYENGLSLKRFYTKLTLNVIFNIRHFLLPCIYLFIEIKSYLSALDDFQSLTIFRDLILDLLLLLSHILKGNYIKVYYKPKSN